MKLTSGRMSCCAHCDDGGANRPAPVSSAQNTPSYAFLQHWKLFPLHAGDLMMCDGGCMRSFHIASEDGCNVLKIPQVNVLPGRST